EETQIMHMIDQEKRIQRKQVQEVLGISQTTSGRILKQMVEDGLIIQRGRGKNTYYMKK
ncbi:winged helix-turn-helix domain-containing protein, partial [Anaerostipes hadrus]|nr:winged helix-turn-helix domain-containing protein [Anaerostipes hadrus]